jgi:ferrochelatase
MARIAVVLFNLGGPDRPESVRPFLFNLFNDPAIIALPGPLRWLVATLISSRRAPVAREIYAHIGGRSPLLEQTEEQARALEAALGGGDEIKAFVAMRYWHPMTEAAVQAVVDFAPDEVVLLPL